MSRLAFLACCLVAGVVQAQTAEDYKEFQKSVEKIISSAREAAATPQEQGDLRVLQFHLQELKAFVAKEDWTSAEYVKRRMQTALQRSSALSADAPRRKAERERAEKERQHRELLKQNDRNHRDLLKQNDRNHREMMDQMRRQEQQRALDQARYRR